MPGTNRSWKRLALVLIAMGALAACGLAAWHLYRTQTVERVVVQGAGHADGAALRALADVVPGERLWTVDPDVTADRLRRHPWVAGADVDRLPTGTLVLEVTERAPVALALERGRPAYFLDRHGFRMPADSGAVYDVPLLRGLPEPYHPVRPVEDAATRALLAGLAEADVAALRLVAELERRPGGEWWALTEPAADRGAIPVRLGRDAFAGRLARLHAFWHQAVLPQPDRLFRRIDLRFDHQIFTDEVSR